MKNKSDFLQASHTPGYPWVSLKDVSHFSPAVLPAIANNMSEKLYIDYRALIVGTLNNSLFMVSLIINNPPRDNALNP